MTRKIIVSIFFTAVMLIACKPYDSTETNKKLLQGSWRLVDIKYIDSDSTLYDLMQDTAYLTFNGNHIMDSVKGNVHSYTFDVNKYSLYLIFDSTRIHKTSIISLSKDTFRMKNKIYNRTYIKEK